MSNPIWNSSYVPYAAENGKFVVLNPSTFTGYPSSGLGKYAVLTYPINQINSTSWIGTSSFGVSGVLNPSIPFVLHRLEIQNLTNNDEVYFIPSAVNYETAKLNGIRINNNTLYTTQVELSSFTIASNSGGSVRIIGYN